MSQELPPGFRVKQLPQAGPQPALSLPDLNEDADNRRADGQLALSSNADSRAEVEAGYKQEVRSKGFDATEGERKAGAFLIRALGANASYEKTGKGARGLTQQALRDAFPDFENQFIGGSRQVADSAQDEFIAASLRQDSGAAIPEEELERQRRIYFPVPGDGPEVIEQKRQARLRAILGLEQSAGRLAQNSRDLFAKAFPDLLQSARSMEDERGEPFAPGVARPGVPEGLLEPEMIGDIPKGSQVELGVDQLGRDEVSKGKQFLESLGIFANDEARITAFWNVNSKNPNLTVETARQWYEANNYPAPTDEDLAGTVEQARQGATFSGIDTSQMDADYEAQLDSRIRQLGINPEDIDRSLAVGGASGTTLGFNDEIMGGIAAAEQALQGGDVQGAYIANRDMRRRVRDRASAENPGTVLGAEVAGSLLAPIGGVGGAAARGGQAAARAAVRSGAAVGAVSGAGYGEGLAGSVGGAALGAPLGALGGGVGERAARSIRMRLAQRARARNSKARAEAGAPSASAAGREVIEAADRFNAETGANIRPLPADVGGAATRRASGAVAQTTFGAKPLVEGGQALQDEARAGVRAIAERQGAVPQSRQLGGEVTMAGAKKRMERDKLKVDALYAKARKEANGVELPLPMAQTVLQQNIEELRKTPGGAEGLEVLQKLAKDIGGTFPIDNIKAMRAQLFIGKDGLHSRDIERRFNEVIDAADLDIEDGLIALGNRKAAEAYAKASEAAAERFKLIDEVLTPILGKQDEKSGEQVFAAIETLSRGDAVSLGKLIRALPSEEAGSLRGVLIDRLGRATKGQQDADGQAFSLGRFLTQWNDEGLSQGAKRALFDGETIAALDDLARVAQGTKEGQRFANFSNTGGATVLNGLMNGTPFVATAAGIVPAAAAAGTSLVAQTQMGRLLASPKFARWLAKMPKQKTPDATRQHVLNLSRIAAADTSIAADTLDLQRQLLAMLSPERVAADPQNKAGSPSATGGGTQ